MSWVDAIKKYSEITGEKFVIPKRESPEYAKIKAIQDKMAKGETIEKLPRAKKPKQVVNPTPASLEPAPTVIKPVAVAETPVVAPEKKQKNVIVVKDEPGKQIIPVIEKKDKKKKVVVAENPVVIKKEAESVVIAKEEPKPKQKKQPKIDNKVKIVELPKGPVVIEKIAEPPKLSLKEAREAKQKAKQERLETQAMRAGQMALQQTRTIMKNNGPYVIDFA
jgi:hypothetical protein